MWDVQPDAEDQNPGEDARGREKNSSHDLSTNEFAKWNADLLVLVGLLEEGTVDGVVAAR